MLHRERPTLRLPDHVCGTDGAPLIEVFSVSIDTYDKDEMKIYGDITITDGEDVTFSFYSRERNNPETVKTGQALSLTFPEYRAISPKGVVKVDVCLMEVNRKAMISDHRNWHYSSKRDYDIPKTEIFRGEGFSAVLEYITYHCAVIGYPKVTILPPKKGGVDGDAQVYGRIVASRIRKYQCIESGATTKEIVLFDESKDKPVPLEYGTTYGLFGAMVVPAYSYVEINAWLQDDITDCVIANDGIALFDSLSFGYEGKFCGSLEVGITWCHPYLQPLPTRELKRDLETSSGSEILVDSEIVDSESEEKSKKPRVLSQQSPSTAMRRNRTLPSTLPWKPKDDWVMSSVMEIFSVSVGHKISKLFGSISVSDIFDHGVIIYKIDQHSPKDLSESNEVGTPTPIGVVGTRRVITGDIFSVHLDLKDEEGRQVSDGHFQWRNDVKYPFFGKRMCCVVTGKHGYAAVHYTAFEAGLPARVEASLSSSVPGEYKIYGVICSEYGNNKCVTYYEQEFYRNRHFVIPRKDPLELCFEPPFSMEAKIPLSKAVVGVPKGSSLDLDVYLFVENKIFREKLICDFGYPNSLKTKRGRFTLHLDVKWNCW